MATKRVMMGLLVLIGIASMSPPAALADAAQAKSTAIQHAGLATNAGDIAGVRRHLHHVLNCLVGPDGAGFDQSAGNPCQGSGAALPQTGDGAEKTMLEELAAKVRAGLVDDSIDAAKQVAASVQEMLGDG